MKEQIFFDRARRDRQKINLTKIMILAFILFLLCAIPAICIGQTSELNQTIYIVDDRCQDSLTYAGHDGDVAKTAMKNGCDVLAVPFDKATETLGVTHNGVNYLIVAPKQKTVVAPQTRNTMKKLIRKIRRGIIFVLGLKKLERKLRLNNGSVAIDFDYIGRDF